jgi:carbonic anhydrase
MEQYRSGMANRPVTNKKLENPVRAKSGRLMEKIVRGYHAFRNSLFEGQRQFFERVARKQQEPKALLITCSDSRIDPNLVTQTEPGDMFILRNAGNIIPPYGSTADGVVATIEYAVAVLKIRDLIVCGHSHCGAMQALLDFEKSPPPGGILKGVLNWFSYAEVTRQIINERYHDLSGEELLTAAVEENVLTQLNHLATHPVVATGLSRGDLRLYGWIYQIETGTIFEYRQGEGRFLPLGDVPTSALPMAVRQPATS